MLRYDGETEEAVGGSPLVSVGGDDFMRTSDVVQVTRQNPLTFVAQPRGWS